MFGVGGGEIADDLGLMPFEHTKEDTSNIGRA
jgi:hypothetical protein